MSGIPISILDKYISIYLYASFSMKQKRSYYSYTKMERKALSCKCPKELYKGNIKNTIILSHTFL